MKTYALSVSILSLAFALIASVFFYNAHLASGSVIMGGEYQATHVVDATSGTSSVKTNAGSVGSFVVSNSSAAAIIRVFDATATTAATSTLTEIFSFDAAATEGTYTYDVAFGNGLMLDVAPSFDGDIVVTYR